jgi:hypothetical protein
MPTQAKRYSPEVIAEAKRMANSRVTGCLYEYELVGALADDPMLGIKYVGQNCGPSLPPDEALVDRHKKHIREAKSCPNKPFSRFINSYGEAAFEGPIPVKTPKGKRIEVMMFLDEQEDKRIMELGGPWRDGSYGNTQTLNKKRGGQGDPFTVLCGLAGRKLKADLASHCEHGRQRSQCKECGGSSIPPQLPQPPSPLFRPGFLAQPGLPLASGFPCASAIFPPLGLFGTPLGTCTHQPTTATAHNEPAQQGHPPTPPPTTALTPKRKAPMSASELHCHGYT